MSKDPEVEMKDVELNEVDQEKQPMTAVEAGNGDGISPTAAEKNGSVKVKMDEEEVKFTGLSKEELLKVAGTPGWVRTRWALLVLFWLGWLGMLAGAIGIIIQAPRCKPLPKMNWWNKGPLYQVANVAAFTEEKTLQGLTKKIDYLSDLKVKGLILGPIHTSKANQPQSLSFTEIEPSLGTMDHFKNLIKTAHKKSISVVLDLTPNYKGHEPWFANGTVTDVAEKLKPALVFWLKEHEVDGVRLSGVERLLNVTPSQWADFRAIVQNFTTDDKTRALFGVTDKTSAVDVAALQNRSGVDLLMSGVLRAALGSEDLAPTIQHLYSSQNQTSLAWSLSDRAHGHLASLGPALLRPHLLLLLTLPGTPILNYGDEIGLEDTQDKVTRMLWDLKNSTEKEMPQTLEFFQQLSDLRGKERSLLHGDFRILHNSTSCLAFLRQWDQSTVFLSALNWGTESVALRLAPPIPAWATVTMATDPTVFLKGSSVKLDSLQLGAGQALLLQYPYSA
ncbi:hypothetical protein COCON_G00072060 [Conger conger]|uniref:Glycosyl hydrolase family 13 catalytic domain-containing protein n=1 Tax=Conger conger TaxID=82655 RepID=A0A9Q1DN24_CONCO|nr:hypothetical protein COCON_G00072060 [Conger conger]